MQLAQSLGAEDSLAHIERMRGCGPDTACLQLAELRAIREKRAQHSNVVGGIVNPQGFTDQFRRSGQPMARVAHMVEADVRLFTAIDVAADASRVNALQEPDVTPQAQGQMP